MGSTELVRMTDQCGWTWSVMTQPNGWGGTQASVLSNRGSRDGSNFCTEIELTHLDPDHIDALAAALQSVAATLRTDGDDEL